MLLKRRIINEALETTWIERVLGPGTRAWPPDGLCGI